MHNICEIGHPLGSEDNSHSCGCSKNNKKKFNSMKKDNDGTTCLTRDTIYLITYHHINNICSLAQATYVIRF